jgi:hypothetical protein
VEDFQAQLLLDEEEGLSLAAPSAPIPDRRADRQDEDDDDGGNFHDGLDSKKSKILKNNYLSTHIN